MFVGQGLRCSLAYGKFLNQGWNLCPLHWQVDSSPLDHQGSPSARLLDHNIVLHLWTIHRPSVKEKVASAGPK